MDHEKRNGDMLLLRMAWQNANVLVINLCHIRDQDVFRA
jgi:hypothetical protein